MAKIKEEDIDALRERADILEIVSAYSQMKRAGEHSFKGLCPFHTEKTPSFTVDVAKGLFHCWGCGEGGNIYQFIQKAENLPFPDAVEWLARKSGYELRYEEMRPGEQRTAGIKARLIAANEAAARFWHEELVRSPEANEARRYLEGRGFGKEVAKRWMLGYAPGYDRTIRHLRTKGFTQEEIEKADLGRKSERDGSFYDVFRKRIIFPTWNHQGDIVGFGARAQGDAQPKYLNSSETPVFSKSRVMFGLDKAKASIARGEPAIVVEGYTDVIALHEAGIAEAVATNGVALGDSHFELLKKWTERVVLMLDSDQAGQGATERSFGIQHRMGVEVLVAPLPAGRDPADVVIEDGADGIRKAIDAARPLLEFKLDQTIAKLPIDTPEARARAVRRAAEVLGWHPDPIARHEYAFLVADRIGVDADAVQRALDEIRSVPVGRGGLAADADNGRRIPGHVKVEREALRLLLTQSRGTLSQGIDLGESAFTAAPRRELFAAAKSALDQGSTGLGSGAAQELSPGALTLFTELTVGVELDPGSDLVRRAEEIFTRLKVFELEREIKTRRDTLEKVNPLDDPEQHDALFTELVGLEAQRRDLLKRLLRGE